MIWVIKVRVKMTLRDRGRARLRGLGSALGCKVMWVLAVDILLAIGFLVEAGCVLIVVGMIL